MLWHFREEGVVLDSVFQPECFRHARDLGPYVTGILPQAGMNQFNALEKPGIRTRTLNHAVLWPCSYPEVENIRSQERRNPKSRSHKAQNFRSACHGAILPAPGSIHGASMLCAAEALRGSAFGLSGGFWGTGALGSGFGVQVFGALRGAACRYSYKVFQDWCWRLPGFLESEKNFTTDYIMSFVSVCLVSRVCGFSG